MAPVLVLIGSPGAGKSTVGRRVAEALGVPFTDSDALVESAAGMSVPDIFVTAGEEEFRRLEAIAVATALDESTGVVSLGGGAILSPDTRARLAGHRVVWLKVSVADAAKRVGMNTARPLLLGNVRGTLSTLLDQRNPLYEEVASDVVDTTGHSQREVVAEVLQVMKSV